MVVVGAVRAWGVVVGGGWSMVHCRSYLSRLCRQIVSEW